MNPGLELIAVAGAHGLPPAVSLVGRGRVASDARAEWYQRLVASGYSQSAIARIAGRHPSTVHHAIHRHGKADGRMKDKTGKATL